MLPLADADEDRLGLADAERLGLAEADPLGELDPLADADRLTEDDPLAEVEESDRLALEGWLAPLDPLAEAGDPLAEAEKPDRLALEGWLAPLDEADGAWDELTDPLADDHCDWDPLVEDDVLEDPGGVLEPLDVDDPLGVADPLVEPTLGHDAAELLLLVGWVTVTRTRRVA